jgi:hypothetical protein
MVDRKRAKQWVLLLGAISIGLAYWWLTFDGCGFSFRCW